MKKKLAIISTWNELCGIAHYTIYLKKALEAEYDVDVIPLPRKIFSIIRPNVHEKQIADEYIDKIVKKLSDYDIVNIQYEPGIFGRTFDIIIKRVKKVIKAAPELIITFHSINREPPLSYQALFDNLKRFRIVPIMHQMHSRNNKKLCEGLYDFLNDQLKNKNISAITHTNRDKLYLSTRLKCVINSVPLIYHDKETRDNLENLVKHSALKNKIVPAKKTRYMGVFGFISDYKGYINALKALTILPENYELLIFGSLHEGHLSFRMTTHPFVQELIDFVAYQTNKEEEKNSKSKNGPVVKKLFYERVHFHGSVSDDDMLVGMMCCDAVLFPYINSEQTASGPLSLAVELQRSIIASRNTPFLELANYYPDNFELVDIGNYYEIAEKVKKATAEVSEERNVDGLRWVYFDKKGTVLYPEKSLLAYKSANEGREVDITAE